VPRLHFEDPAAADNYDAYIAWKRLSCSGHRDRSEMSPGQQAEWDSWGLSQAEPMSSAQQAEVEVLYQAVTGRL
jgi:hypothetical protein